MTSLIDIGTGLVAARRAAAVSQRELGERLGVKQPQIARWEANAYRGVALARLDEVARALGVDVEVPIAAPQLSAAESRAAYSVRARPPCPPSTPAEILERLGTTPRALASVCRRHPIAELDVFGSAVRDDFRPDSDVDILVRYAEGSHPSLAVQLEIENDLGELFGRRVDLAERGAVERSENYVRRRHILGASRVLYVA